MRASENTVPQKSRPTSTYMLHGRKSYAPGVREPYKLPDDKVVLPKPEPMPQSPPVFNLFTLLPPVLIIVVMLIFGRANMSLMGTTIAMSLGFPLANVINVAVQRRKYKKNLENRRLKYQRALDEQRNFLLRQVQQQRSVLEHEYTRASQVMELALKQGERSRLWWRRPQDSDFLSLRIGKGKGKPSFTVTVPNFPDTNEPLAHMPLELLREFEDISDLPFLIDLKKVGSIGIVGNTSDVSYGATRRLVLDILVHHSPNDIQLIVLSDKDDGAERWEWLKWVPHTDVLKTNLKEHFLAFNQGKISDVLEWVRRQEHQRRDTMNHSGFVEGSNKSIVVLMDDSGRIRQQAGLGSIVEKGFDIGIFLIFVGDRNLPRVRARLDVSDQKAFRYIETWEGGATQRGQAELIHTTEAETTARSLAQIAPLGERSSLSLPDSIRVSEILNANLLLPNEVSHNWSEPRSDRELLQFPIGIHIGREGLEQTTINLLPAEKEGLDAYHTILIGTTGSGKSEFMKSLVLGAAYKYSANQLNFFFLDFKGGAAFNVFKELPHVVGTVTNLRPELVERGLDAIEAEIERRQEKFATHEVQNIWAYNKRFESQPMPHMLLLLDEFAKGLEDFPRLPDILQLLVRQGRSLGMYLILANQDVTSAVDNLLTNIGWRIALKVAKQQEMHMISKELPPTKRAGHGYLRSLNGDIYEFQAGYAGLPILTQAAKSSDQFVIYKVANDGEHQSLFTYSSQRDEQKENEPQQPSEEIKLIEIMRREAQEMGLVGTRPIYLDPLPSEIPLEQVWQKTPHYREFSSDGWGEPQVEKNRLVIPVGYLDFPKDCIQQPLLVNFTEQDSHLWVVGSPGSGKTRSLTTILLSLTLSHTPEDVNIYILEYGAGSLRAFEGLPHVGAVIRLNEKERLERLLNYLDQIM